jgi:hypothetical protein
MSCFPTCKLTALELVDCRQFDPTSEEPEWDPTSTTYQEQEDASVDARGMVRETLGHNTGDGNNRRFISSVKVSCCSRAEAFVRTNS